MTTPKKARIDADDVLALVGFAMIVGGLWWMWPPLALVCVGAVLLFVAAHRARHARSR